MGRQDPTDLQMFLLNWDNPKSAASGPHSVSRRAPWAFHDRAAAKSKMSDLSQAQKRGFGKRILTDSTAVFRLKDIECNLRRGTARSCESDRVLRLSRLCRQRLHRCPFRGGTWRTRTYLVSGGRSRPRCCRHDPTGSSILSTGGAIGSEGAANRFPLRRRGGVRCVTTTLATSRGRIPPRYSDIVAGRMRGIWTSKWGAGTTAYALGVETTRSLANLAQAVQKGQNAVDDFPMAQHDSGVYILDQQDLAEVEHVGADGFTQCVHRSRKNL